MLSGLAPSLQCQGHSGSNTGTGPGAGGFAGSGDPDVAKDTGRTIDVCEMLLKKFKPNPSAAAIHAKQPTCPFLDSKGSEDTSNSKASGTGRKSFLALFSGIDFEVVNNFYGTHLVDSCSHH